MIGASEVKIKNKESLRLKLQRFKSDGANELSILADFDQTLSKYFYPPGRENGQALSHVDACMKVMLRSDKMKESQQRETRDAFEKYRPIEMDSNLSLEEKARHMLEWWTCNLKTFASTNVARSDFKEMLARSKMALRLGISELLEQTSAHAIPLVVVSGGLKPVIEETFRQVS